MVCGKAAFDCQLFIFPFLLSPLARVFEKSEIEFTCSSYLEYSEAGRRTGREHHAAERGAARDAVHVRQQRYTGVTQDRCNNLMQYKIV